MAISVRARTAWSVVTADTTVTIPTGSTTGDRMYVFAAWKAFGTTATVDGWTEITEFADGSVAAGANVGSVKVGAWYKDHTGSESNPTVDFSVSPAPGAVCAITLQKGAGDVWDTPTFVTAAISAATTWSATSSSTITIKDGAIVLELAGFRDDSATMTRSSTTALEDDGSPNVTWNGNVVEDPATHASSTTSNDISADLIHRFVTTGASGVNLTATGTLAASETGAVLWVHQGISVPSSTSVAEVGLPDIVDPANDTNHKILIRGRVTSGPTGTPTLKAALYEGANNRSGDLTTSTLTTSLADYELTITTGAAATITDYDNLSIRFWGYDIDGGADVYEVDYIALQLPESPAPPTEAEHAAITLAAQQARGGVSPTAGNAAATVAAGAAAPKVSPTAGHASITLVSFDTLGLSGTSAGNAAISIAAGSVTATTTTAAGHAAVTVEAYDIGVSISQPGPAGHAAISFTAYDGSTATTTTLEVDAEIAEIEFWASEADHSDLDSTSQQSAATMAALAPSPSVGPTGVVVGPTLTAFSATISTVGFTPASAEHAALTIAAGTIARGSTADVGSVVLDAGTPLAGLGTNSGLASVQFSISAFDVTASGVSLHRAFAELAAIDIVATIPGFDISMTAGHASITFDSDNVDTPAVGADLSVTITSFSDIVLDISSEGTWIGVEVF